MLILCIRYQVEINKVQTTGYNLFTAGKVVIHILTAENRQKYAKYSSGGHFRRLSHLGIDE